MEETRSQPQSIEENRQKETPSKKEKQDTNNDIHLYRRVRMIDVVLRILQEALRENTEPVAEVGSGNAAIDDHFMDHLVTSSGFSKEECLSAMKGVYGES